MATPDLTVVISTHARPVEVREAVGAVRDQTWDGPIETIVVYDKADPDPELERDDPLRPVRVMKNHRTPGLQGSRNSGAEAAGAPVLGFCDDDDMWMPTKAAAQLELLESDGVTASTTGMRLVSPEGETDRLTGSSQLTFTDLLSSRHIEANMVTAMVTADAFWNVIGPMDEEIPGGYGEDYDWVLRAARHSPIAVVDSPQVLIRWNGDSTFRQDWATIDEALGYLLAKFPEFDDVPAGKARLEGQRAFARAAQGDRRDALRQSRATMRLHLAEPRAWIAVVVAAGLVSPTRVLQLLSGRGRGI